MSASRRGRSDRLKKMADEIPAVGQRLRRESFLENQNKELKKQVKDLEAAQTARSQSASIEETPKRPVPLWDTILSTVVIVICLTILGGIGYVVYLHETNKTAPPASGQ